MQAAGIRTPYNNRRRGDSTRSKHAESDRGPRDRMQRRTYLDRLLHLLCSAPHTLVHLCPPHVFHVFQQGSHPVWFLCRGAKNVYIVPGEREEAKVEEGEYRVGVCTLSYCSATTKRFTDTSDIHGYRRLDTASARGRTREGATLHALWNRAMVDYRPQALCSRAMKETPCQTRLHQIKCYGTWAKGSPRYGCAMCQKKGARGWRLERYSHKTRPIGYCP